MKNEKEDYSEDSKHSGGGDKKPDKNTKSDTIITEEFQHKAQELIKGCTRKELDYIRGCCSERDNELYKAENKPAKMSIKELPHD
jgi:hypothetical protein